MREFDEHFNSTVSLLCIPWIVLAREFRVKQVIPVVLVGAGAQPVPLLPGAQNPPGRSAESSDSTQNGLLLLQELGGLVLGTVLTEKLFSFHLVFQQFSEEKAKENLEKVLQGRESELMRTPLVVEPVVSIEDPEISYFPLTFGQCKCVTHGNPFSTLLQTERLSGVL